MNELTVIHNKITQNIYEKFYPDTCKILCKIFHLVYKILPEYEKLSTL